MSITDQTTQIAKKVKLSVHTKKLLADTYTPVSIYLKLRDHFGGSVLLESTDFRSMENCFSFIAVEPIATFKVQNGLTESVIAPGDVQIN